MVDTHFLKNEFEAYAFLSESGFSVVVAYPGIDDRANIIIPCKKNKRCCNSKILSCSFSYFLRGCINCDLYHVTLHFDDDCLDHYHYFDETDIKLS